MHNLHRASNRSDNRGASCPARFTVTTRALLIAERRRHVGPPQEVGAPFGSWPPIGRAPRSIGCALSSLTALLLVEKQHCFSERWSESKPRTQWGTSRAQMNPSVKASGATRKREAAVYRENDWISDSEPWSYLEGTRSYQGLPLHQVAHLANTSGTKRKKDDSGKA